MTRNEFMTALRKRLSHLPAEEQDAALKYYEEYFDEAESEEEAARQLGSPDAIADRILADYGAGNAARKGQKEGRSPWFYVAIVLLCVLFSPVLLGVGAAALAAALTIAAAFLVAVVGILGGFLAASPCAAGAVPRVPVRQLSGLCRLCAGGAILLGLALVCGGLGVLCGIFTGYLCYWTGLLMKKIFTAGRRKKGAEAE